MGNLAKRRKVNVIQARGTFVNSTTIQLEGDHESIPSGNQITFDHCILATGSVPAMPPAFQIGSDRVMDSTGALALQDIPETMLVVGGGYIGLEMGSVYAQLGSKVTVVELAEGLACRVPIVILSSHWPNASTNCARAVCCSTPRVGSMAESGDKVEVTFEGPRSLRSRAI